MLSITTAQAEALLKVLIPVRAVPLLASPPGLGKSAIEEQVAAYLGRRNYTFYPVCDDPTNFRGFPWFLKDKGRAEFITYGDFDDLLHATEPTVAFFDDFGHAPKAVQATLMHPFHARTLNGKRISDHVSFVIATNRRGDRAGVEGVIDPILSRCRVFDIRPDLDSFLAYWIRTNKRPEVMAYLRFRPDHLYVQKKSADIENFPCYRTWDYVAQDLSLNVGPALEVPLFAGSVGEGVAGEFCTYLRVYREMPDPDELLEHPEKARIPDNLSVLYALCVAIAYRTTRKTFPAVGTFIDRLSKAGKEEVAVFLLNDSLQRCPDVKTLPECSKILCGSLGKMIISSE